MDIFKHLNKTEIEDLCNKINMPPEATESVLNIIDIFDFSNIQPFFSMLFDVKTGAECVEKLNELLKDNENKGFILLATSLSAALITKENYKAMGISDDIFYATMGCFSRFVKEHKESYGVYGFDRFFWTFRQIAQSLYRLGTLEFEMITYNNDELASRGEVVLQKGEQALSVHIPSDAKTTTENCHEAYQMAAVFFQKYHPQFQYQVFYCTTWLLAPNLKHVLKEGSNILQFQSDFEICKEMPENTAFMLWVFKRSDIDIDHCPENTSLQRNIKAYIKNGGQLGSATGIIRKSKFGK